MYKNVSTALHSYKNNAHILRFNAQGPIPIWQGAASAVLLPVFVGLDACCRHTQHVIPQANPTVSSSVLLHILYICFLPLSFVYQNSGQVSSTSRSLKGTSNSCACSLDAPPQTLPGRYSQRKNKEDKGIDDIGCGQEMAAVITVPQGLG